MSLDGERQVEVEVTQHTLNSNNAYVGVDASRFKDKIDEHDSSGGQEIQAVSQVIQDVSKT